LISETESCGACALGTKVKDTIKLANNDNIIEKTLPRENLWAAATPQAFNAVVIRDAYSRAQADGFTGTDDCALVERMGVNIKIIECSYNNIKITTPEDIYIGEKILNDTYR